MNKLKLKELEERKRKDYQGEIMKHLNEVDMRRSQVIQKNSLKLKEMMLKEEKKFERNMKNRENLMKGQEEIATLLLERQAQLIEKASLKDSKDYLNKLNS